MMVEKILAFPKIIKKSHPCQDGCCIIKVYKIIEERFTVHGTRFVNREPCTVSMLFRVMQHTVKIDQHAGFVTNHPGIMTGRNDTDIARTVFFLRSVIHLYMQAARNMEIVVRHLATVGFRDRFHRFRPFPAGFEYGPAEDFSINRYKIQPALREGTRFFYVCACVSKIVRFNGTTPPCRASISFRKGIG